MARELICPKNARTRILHILSDSVPQTIRFTAEPVEAGQGNDGSVEVERGGLVFGKKVESTALEHRNKFRKGFLQSRYAVFVTPEQDTRIVFQSRHFTSKWLFISLGAVLALGVISGFGVILLRWLG